MMFAKFGVSKTSGIARVCRQNNIYIFFLQNQKLPPKHKSLFLHMLGIDMGHDSLCKNELLLPSSTP